MPDGHLGSAPRHGQAEAASGTASIPPATVLALAQSLIGGDSDAEPASAAAPDASSLVGGVAPGLLGRDQVEEVLREQACLAAGFVAAWVKDWHPDWWFNLCALPADGGDPIGRSWKSSEVAEKVSEIAAFIVRHNGLGRCCGIYFTVNPLKERVDKKPDGEQVAAYVALHIDVDPAIGERRDYAAAKAALWASITEAIRNQALTLTAVIDSGNGAGLFCQLAEPETDRAKGKRACAAFQAEARSLLDGKVDPTADAARLMRLPHALNWPNASKRARGYPKAPSWSSVRWQHESPRIAPEEVAALATRAPEHVGADPASVPQEQHRAPSAERLEAAVRAIPNTGTKGYHEWILMIRAIRAAGTGVLEDDGEALARWWTDQYQGAVSEQFEKHWPSVAGPSKVGWEYLVDAARDAGWERGRFESTLLDFADVVAELAAAAKAAAARQRARFPLRTMADCAASEARQYVIKGSVAQGDLAILFGPPGAGKSALAPYLAHAVSTGREVFGRRVRSCRVLYIAAEDGHGMRGRMRALQAQHGDAPGFFLIDEPPNLGNPVDVAAIQARIAECGPGLIFVDTLAAAFPGLKENESEDMGRAVAALRALSKPTGAAVVVHHGTKGNDRGPRGHSLLNGAADLTLEVDAPAAGKSERTVTFGKNRNGPADGMAWHFAVKGEPIGLDADGDVETAAFAFEVPAGARRAPKLSDLQKKGLAALHAMVKANGTALPTGDGFPGEATDGVELTAWRKECDRRGMSGAEDAKARARAFKRVCDALHGACLIEMRDEWVWLIR